MADPVILSAVRLPTGRFQGALSGFAAPQLGALVVREAVRRAGVDPAAVEECILGNVVSAGLGQAPARQAALRAGLSDAVAALTINKVCGSGLKAVMLAAQGIATGDIEVAVAGGMESMTNAPYLLDRARGGYRLGLRAPWTPWCTTGCGARSRIGTWARRPKSLPPNITCPARPRMPLRSTATAKPQARRPRGASTPRSWRWNSRVPKGATTTFARDEAVRADTSLAALAGLKPAFVTDGSGTVTAGNAPPLSDGAAALVVASAQRAAAAGVTPLARIVAQATSGLDPKHVLMTPVAAVRRVLAKAGWPSTASTSSRSTRRSRPRWSRCSVNWDSIRRGST